MAPSDGHVLTTPEQLQSLPSAQQIRADVVAAFDALGARALLPSEITRACLLMADFEATWPGPLTADERRTVAMGCAALNMERAA